MKGLMLLHNNMEDVESIGTRAFLERAGINVVTATFNRDKRVHTYYGVTVEADLLYREVNPADYEFLIIPGGRYVVNVIKDDVNIKNLVKEFHKQNKLIAAICAGPMFLGALGLLENKQYTIFPGCERDTDKGVLTQDKKVVVDGNIITARSVAAVLEFSYEIIKHIKGNAVAEDFLKGIYY